MIIIFALGAASAVLPAAAVAASPEGDIKLNLDLTWMLMAAGLVMMMQVGFLLLEAGMVRSKNSVNVAQKNLLDFVFGVVAFAAIGFMIAFGRSDGFIVGWQSDFYFLARLDAWQSGFFVFQVMFCGTAATIVSGAVAERMKLSAYVLGSLLLSGLIYPVFVHWAWGSALTANASSFLGNLGFVDFAGSTVVHATGGWVSLAACMVMGPRAGRFDASGNPVRIAGHSPVLSTTGALLLFIGWIGFNGGSTVQARPDMAFIIMNTVLAGGMGTCVGYVLGFYQDGVVLPEKSLSGMLGGLVAVTAGCQVLTPGGALVIGAIGSVVAIYGNILVERHWKVDDAVGAIGIHAFAGVAGTLALALLAPVHHLPAGGRMAQLYIQIFGAGINFYWSFCIGYGFFWLLDRLVRIRVTPYQEEIGLNIAEHDTRLGVGHVEDALFELVNGTADLSQRLPVVSGDEAEKLTLLFNRMMDNVEAKEREKGKSLATRRDEQEAERVAAIANATFEAIVIHRDGLIIDGNAQLERLANLPIALIIGQQISDFLPPEEQTKVLASAKSGREGSFETVLLSADGERVPVEISSREIVYRGEPCRIGCIVDLRDRKEAERHIRHLALHDPLTGLPNRALFNEQLAQWVERAAEHGGCGLLLVDLDRFKDINDIHGHQAGDAVIHEAARRLASLVGRDDMVARLGGDEFAVILANACFENQLADFGRRLLDLFSEPFDIGFGEQVKCSISIGGALCPSHAGDPESLFACADVALYESKNSGRNGWKIFKRGMNALTERRRELEADLALALERREFEVYLQPRVNARTAEISGYEALLRWNHPSRGQVSPVDFIPVAEASGKIIPIGEWVLRESCRILKAHLGERHISINVSPIQFRHSDFMNTLSEIVRHAGIRPCQIELEITESVLIDDDKRALQILTDLKRIGFNIALDDFGTGYSSLSYLSRYPFDTIKIDRSFVSNLGIAENAAVIVRTIIDLGSGLGMNVVAEGVETLEEAQFLAAAGCDELQGYLLGRPQPLHRLLQFVEATVAAHIRQQAVLPDNQKTELDNMARLLRGPDDVQRANVA